MSNRMLLFVLVAAAITGCSDGGAPSVETAPLELPAELTVDYGPADEWLDTVPVEERTDQIRDWALIALAASLDLDAHATRDFYFDKSPVRDPILRDFATFSIGPGRFLPERASTLHVLAPTDDPHLDRTIGIALDDHRKDAGTDFHTTRIHRYRIDEAGSHLSLRIGAPESTAAVRTRHGYRYQPIDDLASLEEFLADSDHLSRLELRDGRLLASGWRWPGAPTGRVTAEDLTVLQRGYATAARHGGPDPGFSLDPGPPGISDEEFVEMFESADRSEAKRILRLVNDAVEADLRQSRNGGEPAFIVLDAEIQNLLEHDRDLTSIALNTWVQEPVYQFARYDGGVQGTEVGMTYFYTDLVAKAWPMEKGVGTPTGAVAGFVSDLEAQTPWGYCEDDFEESGRLWFGLREEGVGPSAQGIDFGGLTTRLFSKVTDPDSLDPTDEVEPSFRFGRVMRWWDDHYVAIADFEPEYHRLDQLMRWGAAIAWLVNEQGPALPEVPPQLVGTDRTFREWMAEGSQLRWRYSGRWVQPRGVTTEALPTLTSRPHADCGGGVVWSGGISSPDRATLARLTEAPHLPAEVSRGGLLSERTSFDALDRSGTLGRERVLYRLLPVDGRTARVQMESAGSKVWSLGRVRVAIRENVLRRAASIITAGNRRIQHSLFVHSVELGRLSVDAQDSGITVTWTPGVLDSLRRALTNLQDRLVVDGFPAAVRRAEGSTLAYIETSRQAHFEVPGTTGFRWAVAESGLPEVDDRLQFRLGAPGPEGIRPYRIRLEQEPPPLNDRPGSFMRLDPNGNGPAILSGSGPPPVGAHRFAVLDPEEDRRGYLYTDGRRIWVQMADRVVGLQGTQAARSLTRPKVLQRVLARSDDGYAYLIPLDRHRVAILEGRVIHPIDQGHRWHAELQEILARADGEETPRVRKLDDDKFADLDDLGTSGRGAPASRAVREAILERLFEDGGIDDPRGPPTFLSQSAQVVLQEPDMPFQVLPERLQVHVVEVPREREKLPDIGLWDGTEWRLLHPAVARAAGRGADRTVHLVFDQADCLPEWAATVRMRCHDTSAPERVVPPA